jgi:opacity protein-like surface antigen
MKKFVLLAALLAMLAVAAVPALADRNNHHNHNNNGGGDPAITQDNEQDVDSGEVNQSFNVTGGGDNSNQCVGLQGVANTGNAQNQTSIIQYASEADDFDFEDSGASLEVSPENSTTCDQQVNQAASASGK